MDSWHSEIRSLAWLRFGKRIVRPPTLWESANLHKARRKDPIVKRGAMKCASLPVCLEIMARWSASWIGGLICTKRDCFDQNRTGLRHPCSGSPDHPLAGSGALGGRREHPLYRPPLSKTDTRSHRNPLLLRMRRSRPAADLFVQHSSAAHARPDSRAALA